MPKVLVFDGRSRAALAIVRSLGKKNVDVVISDSYKTLSFYSKYAKTKVIYPDAQLYPKDFLEWLLNYLTTYHIDFIIPVRDDTMEICVFNHERISKLTKLCVPLERSFEIARNKENTIILARKLNIPHPKTLLPSEYGNMSANEIQRTLNFPVLLKPKISSGSRGIEIIESLENLNNTLKRINEEHENMPLLQEFIPNGGAYGVEVLMNHGEIKAKFAHKRIREFPTSGGPGTLREGVVYPGIEKHAIALLQEIKWNGVAMVEYRVNAINNIPYLMEINPRFWGSLQTGIFSGVDFPNLLLELGTKGNCETVIEYPVGKRARWLLFGDILWFLKTSNKLKNIKEFMHFKDENLCYDIISSDDFMPTIGVFREAFMTLFNFQKIKHIFMRGWKNPK